jgi:hypothetical protein
MVFHTFLSLFTSDRAYSSLVVVLAMTSVLVPIFEGQKTLPIARYLAFGYDPNAS